MKTLLCLATMLWCASAAAQPANNPIFYGGIQDGSSSAQNTPLSAANQSGGTGTGANAGTSNAQIAANQSGGAADGAALAANIAVNALTNGGGIGHGASNTAKDAPLALTNTGGTGDGWNSIAKEAPLPLTNGGGIGDGWSGAATTPLLAANQYGGVGDGWTGANFIGPFVPPTPLPQQFLSFTAEKLGEDVRLDWRMSNEKGIDRYVVERSSNAVTFAPIGEVIWQEAAKGSYVFMDEKPLPGHNYYRIRVMSASGEKLTPVRLLVFDETPTTLAMKLYPNPATTRLQVALPAAWIGGNVVLNVYAANGVLVLQQKLVPLSVSEVLLTVEALAPGVYTLQAATDVESLRERFVKR